jgi:DnaK suppressor protein
MMARAANLIDAELARRAAELRERIARIEVERSDPVSPDAAEQAVEREPDEVLDGLETTLVAELRETEGALERLATGTYGVCAACGEPIDPARLRALPTARRCMACEAE